MTTTDTISAVLEFLASYRSAFAAYDADDIVRHYAFPCHIVSDGDPVALMPFDGPAALKPAVERVLALHRKIGASTARALLLEITDLSPRLAGMMLRFEMQDASGQPLYDYQGFYSLVLGDDGYRIVAISHNQIPRLLARVGRASIAAA